MTAASTTALNHGRQPIGAEDMIETKGRYLVKNGQRFLMQGMAFPTSSKYNEQGWIAVLEQLARDTDVNTIRVYRMDCQLHNYTEFLARAAELGMYVIVPVTSTFPKGVLNRNLPAPQCYPRRLYRYGRSCLEQFLLHPNVLAVSIGNEIMNNIVTWKSAPCVKAYARDLRHFMKHYASSNQEVKRTSIPLLYSAQHDSPSANILPPQAMKLTLDYLSCHDDENEDSAHIDVFGINIESWCSSLQTFEFNEDGVTESSYHALYQAMLSTNIPLVLSEVGCSKKLWNRDNGLQRYVRDWHQIPIILEKMSNAFSGFCAYAYDGNPDFRIMGGKDPWNGMDALQPSDDYDNFRTQLHLATTLSSPAIATAGSNETEPVVCSTALQQLDDAWNVRLVSVGNMRSYFARSMLFSNARIMVSSAVPVGGACLLLLVVVCLFMISSLVRCLKKKNHRQAANGVRLLASSQIQYQSIQQKEEP